MKLTPLAGRLGVSVPTLDKWASRYRRFLSPRAGESEPRTAPEFNESDVLVMVTVAHLRKQKIWHGRISEILEDGWRVDAEPWMSELEDDEQHAIEALPDGVEGLKAEAQRALTELDVVRRRERRILEHLADLSREIDQLEWQRSSAPDGEVEGLKEEGARLRAELEADRQRKRGLSRRP